MVVHRRSSHVNLRELEGCCSSCEDMTELTLAPTRLVNGTDSTVSLGSVAKGRSGSLRLNSVFRKSCFRKILGRKSQHNFKLPSADNPSAAPGG